MVRYEPNAKVWVKIEGFSWWPAVVVPQDYEKAGEDVFEAHEGEDTLVLFYGTREFSWINQKDGVNIVDFDSKYESFKKIDKTRQFRESVREAKAGEEILGDSMEEEEEEEEAAYDGNGNDDGEFDYEEELQQEQKKKSKPKKPSGGKRRKQPSSIPSREEPPKKKQKIEHQPPPQSPEPASSPKPANLKKDVERCKNILTTAISNNNTTNIRRCLDRLNTLPITVNILQTTLIGKIVNKVAKMQDPDLTKKAKSLVKDWKEKVQSHNQSSSNSSAKSPAKPLSSPTNAPSASPKPSTNSSPKPSPKPSPKKPSSNNKSPTLGESEGNNGQSPTPSSQSQDSQNTTTKNNSQQSAKLRSSSTDNIPAQLQKTGSGKRDVVLRKFYTMLATDSEASEERCCRLAEAIEQALCDKNGATSSEYRSEYMALVSNVKRNAELRERILSGSLAPQRLVYMSSEEMMTSEQQQQVEKDYEYNKKKAMNHKKLEASTDRFKCGRCKKRQTTYFQMQTRSADEPMTTFVTCVNCGNHWKFS